MQSNVSFALTQVIWLAPHLIVLISGIILAAKWWRRASRAATLAMIGLGLMLLCELVSMGMNTYWRSGRGGGEQMIAILTYSLYILRSVGLGVLVAAVFAGRVRHGEGRAFEVQNVPGVAVVEQ